MMKNIMPEQVLPDPDKKNWKKSFRLRRDWNKCKIDINNDGKNYDIKKNIIRLIYIIIPKYRPFVQGFSPRFLKNHYLLIKWPDASASLSMTSPYQDPRRFMN